MIDLENLPSRKAVRNKMGRGRWTVKDYAERHGITVGMARIWVRALRAEDRIRLVGTRKVTGPDGKPGRGRPVNVFQVPIGQD